MDITVKNKEELIEILKNINDDNAFIINLEDGDLDEDNGERETGA